MSEILDLDLSNMDDIEQINDTDMAQLMGSNSEDGSDVSKEIDNDMQEEVAAGIKELEAKTEEKSEEPTQESKEEVKKPEEQLKEAIKPESKEEVNTSEEKTEKEVELSPDSQIEVKIDGKVEKVSLQDLKNNYSGKIAFDKKFTQLDREKKELEGEIGKINKFIDELGQTMNRSMLEGFFKVGELKGIAPHQIKQKLIQELIPEIDRLEAMDEDQRRLESEREELNYNRKKHESEVARLKQEQAQRDLRAKIDSIRETHNIDETEWDNAVHQLDTRLPKNEEITPKMVGEFVVYERARASTEEALKTFDNGKYLQDGEVVKQLHAVIMQNPDLTPSDIQDVLSKAFNSVAKDEVEAKVKKTVEAKPTSTQEKKEESSLEFSDWEDIEEQFNL